MDTNQPRCAGVTNRWRRHTRNAIADRDRLNVEEPAPAGWSPWQIVDGDVQSALLGTEYVIAFRHTHIGTTIYLWGKGTPKHRAINAFLGRQLCEATWKSVRSPASLRSRPIGAMPSSVG